MRSPEPPMITSAGRTPRSQFHEAAGLRLAAELVRRHPHTTQLRFGGVEVYGIDTCWAVNAMSGPSEGSILFPGTTAPLVRVAFTGTNHLEPVWPDPIRWLDTPARDAVHRTEATAGLTPPAAVPKSTTPSVLYRVIATAMTIATTSAHNLRLSMHGSFGCHDGRWTMTTGQGTVELEEDGTVTAEHLHTPTDLMTCFTTHDRSIIATTSHLLGPLIG